MAEGTSSEEDQIALRLAKAVALRGAGVDPWGNGFAVPNSCAEVNLAHDAHDAAALDAAPLEYTVAGRVIALRPMGKKLVFVVLRGGTDPRLPALTPSGRRATDLQLFVRMDAVAGDKGSAPGGRIPTASPAGGGGEVPHSDAPGEKSPMASLPAAAAAGTETSLSGWGLLSQLDLGDALVATGRAMRTKTGELSLEVKRLTLAAKSLRPLPEKWHGLSEVETRYRRRYVDLIVNPEVRDVFVARARLVSALRRFLDDRGFLEVETPTLHTPEQAGGAAARPFNTHHNALDLDLKLRIATELHLKRLVVGGLERVYEIGRIWRNEGIDRKHNPEFTSVEFYWAHATWQDLIALTEELLATLAKAVTGGTTIKWGEQPIELAPPYAQVSMVSAVHALFVPETLPAAPGAGASALYDALAAVPDAAWAALDTPGGRSATASPARGGGEVPHSNGQHKPPPTSLGNRVAWAFEAFCERHLPVDRPAFVIDFPLETSPLSRRRDSDPRLVDRFELYVAGMEVANAFSELNDPVDQRQRFEAQLAAKASGDDEAMPFDSDFVRALEHGMPPTAGEGLGIDRLAMLLTNSPSIRDVVLFPLLRPES